MSHEASAQCRERSSGQASAAVGLQSLLQWFLILTKPFGEGTAQENLERQGYRVYYPRLLCPTLRRDRWVERIVSLFPRYLFVQLDTAHQTLAPVGSTLGVARIVRFGTQSAVVPDGIVEGLVRRGDPQTGLHQLNRCRRFEPGSRVRITAGVFSGLEGIFEREAPDERVVVLLTILGRDAPVRVPAGYIRPATATSDCHLRRWP